MSDELLTVDEAAKRLKLHPVTVRNMLRKGTIRGMKLGPQQWRVPESSLQAFIASRMQEQTVTAERKPPAAEPPVRREAMKQ